MVEDIVEEVYFELERYTSTRDLLSQSAAPLRSDLIFEWRSELEATPVPECLRWAHERMLLMVLQFEEVIELQKSEKTTLVGMDSRMSKAVEYLIDALTVAEAEGIQINPDI